MVKVTCYRSTETWESRKEAAAFYLEGAMSCEGSESERYMHIYLQIVSGRAECTDEDF